MKKGIFVQHVFITLGNLKLQTNLQISLHTQRPMPSVPWTLAELRHNRIVQSILQHMSAIQRNVRSREDEDKMYKNN